MSKGKDTAPSFNLDSVKRFLWRYHLTMFTVTAVGGIALAIFSLISVVAQSADTTGIETSSKTEFDQSAIERVKALNDEPSYDFSLPSGQRNNPFSE